MDNIDYNCSHQEKGECNDCLGQMLDQIKAAKAIKQLVSYRKKRWSHDKH